LALTRTDAKTLVYAVQGDSFGLHRMDDWGALGVLWFGSGNPVTELSAVGLIRAHARTVSADVAQPSLYVLPVALALTLALSTRNDALNELRIAELAINGLLHIGQELCCGFVPLDARTGQRLLVGQAALGQTF
jgi:hypothetical protein